MCVHAHNYVLLALTWAHNWLFKRALNHLQLILMVVDFAASILVPNEGTKQQ